MSEWTKGGAAFSAALALFLLLPVTITMLLVAALLAVRPREPWQP